MRSTFKTLFYINRQKTKADGNTAILCRITIDGKSTAISTGEECNPSEWNTKQGLTTNRKTNWKSHTNLTHPGKYFRPSKVKIMRPTSPK